MSVYFATCREANAVKIGSSIEPHQRLVELQAYCPLLLTLEAVLPGGREEEQTFHRRFEDERIRGEWFTITEMMELIIAANPAGPRPEKPVQRAPRPSGPRLDRAPRDIHDAYLLESQRKRYKAAMAEMRAAQAGQAA